ncbi:hypothetical protein ACJX0J_034951, partial [Zea mays]
TQITNTYMYMAVPFHNNMFRVRDRHACRWFGLEAGALDARGSKLMSDKKDSSFLDFIGDITAIKRIVLGIHYNVYRKT